MKPTQDSSFRIVAVGFILRLFKTPLADDVLISQINHIYKLSRKGLECI